MYRHTYKGSGIVGYEPEACLYSVTFNRTYQLIIAQYVSHLSCHTLLMLTPSCTQTHKHPPHWPPKAGCSVTHVMGDFEAVGEQRIWVGGLCG